MVTVAEEAGRWPQAAPQLCSCWQSMVELLFSRLEKQHTPTTLVVAALRVSYFSYCEVYRALEQLPTVRCFLALHQVQSGCFPPTILTGKLDQEPAAGIQETDCVPTFLQSSLFKMQALLADMLRGRQLGMGLSFLFTGKPSVFN